MCDYIRKGMKKGWIQFGRTCITLAEWPLCGSEIGLERH